jgi:hypothetical protein
MPGANSIVESPVELLSYQTLFQSPKLIVSKMAFAGYNHQDLQVGKLQKQNLCIPGCHCPRGHVHKHRSMLVVQQG